MRCQNMESAKQTAKANATQTRVAWGVFFDVSGNAHAERWASCKDVDGAEPIPAVIRCGDVRHGESFSLCGQGAVYRRVTLASPLKLVSPVSDGSACVVAIDQTDHVSAIHPENSVELLD